MLTNAVTNIFHLGCRYLKDSILSKETEKISGRFRHFCGNLEAAMDN